MGFSEVPSDSNFKTGFKLFIHHLVLDNDCCISWNVGKSEIDCTCHILLLDGC